MTKATTDRMAFAYAVQSDFDTAATTGFKYARITSDGLTRPDQTVQSAELRQDRQVADQIPTSQHAEGSIGAEFSYLGHTDWLTAVLEAATSTLTKNIDNVSATATGSLLSATNIETGLSVGDWVMASGFSNEENNGWHRVTDVGTAGEIAVASTLVDEGAEAGQFVKISSLITNGTTARYYTMYRDYQDLTDQKARHIGMRFTGWDWNLSGRGVITQSFSVMGKSETTETSVLGGAPTAAETNPIMRGRDSIQGVYIGGVKRGTTQLQLQVNNNGRILDQDVGNGADPCGVNLGKIAVTGTHSGYYEDSSVLNYAFAREIQSLAIATTDELGNGYLIDIPQCRWGSPTRSAGGENQDIIAGASFAARLDPTLGTIRIFGAAA